MANDTMQKSVRHYENMRDSGVKWIGMVPNHWETRKIKYLATKPGTCFTDGDWINSTDISTEGIRYLTTGNIGQGVFKEQGSGFITEDTFRRLGCFEVHSGDLVISRLNAPIGRACILPPKYERCVVAVDNVVLRPNAEYLKEFLMYAMSTDQYSEYTLLLSRGTTMSRISRTQLGDIPLPIAPIEEQSKIVNYLNHYCQKINSVVYEMAGTIKDYKAWKSSIIHEVVTKGLNRNIEMKESGVEYLGKVVSSWDVVRLKFLLSAPLQYGANEAGLPYDKQLPRYIRITDISLDGQLKVEGMQSISEEVAQKYLLDDGDILLARSGATAGKSFYYKSEYGRSAFAGYLIRAKINSDKALPKYIYYTTLGAGYDMWRSSTLIQSTIQNISAARYNEYIIALPSIPEQRKIVSFLDKMCSSIDDLIAEKNALIAELESYKKSLIFEAVTGKRKVV